MLKFIAATLLVVAAIITAPGVMTPASAGSCNIRNAKSSLEDAARYFRYGDVDRAQRKVAEAQDELANCH